MASWLSGYSSRMCVQNVPFRSDITPLYFYRALQTFLTFWKARKACLDFKGAFWVLWMCVCRLVQFVSPEFQLAFQLLFPAKYAWRTYTKYFWATWDANSVDMVAALPGSFMWPCKYGHMKLPVITETICAFRAKLTSSKGGQSNNEAKPPFLPDIIC